MKYTESTFGYIALCKGISHTVSCELIMLILLSDFSKDVNSLSTLVTYISKAMENEKILQEMKGVNYKHLNKKGLKQFYKFGIKFTTCYSAYDYENILSTYKNERSELIKLVRNELHTILQNTKGLRLLSHERDRCWDTTEEIFENINKQTTVCRNFFFAYYK